jgi:serine/threonine protein kinase
MEALAQQIPPGEQIGPYQVVRRLGAGGMGEVYLARHRHLNRDAAVKVLLAEISMNQTVVSRFFTEARATAQLRHPNIVEIFDCDILSDGRAYIVMEFLRGESLRSTLDRLKKLCPDYGSIAAITGMVADALQAAHENGIVHRDLKPDNTYLTSHANKSGELIVKVLDFGIAKLLSGSGTTGGATPTRTGSLVGTPLYMSPEQCRGISNIDHRADIYSLGCMLFEMIVGQPPFVSDAPGDILMAHIIQPAPSLTSFEPTVPPEIDTLVARMLAKDPALRPQTMSEIVGLIETLLGIGKNEFSLALQRPMGFPEFSAQIPTQILPPAESSPPRATPPPPKLEVPSSREVAITTPLGLGTPPPIGPVTSVTRPKPTPPAHAATPSRQKSIPSASSRQRPGTGESPFGSAVGKPNQIPKPRWILPTVLIVLIVASGGVAAYYLTRPSPLTNDSETAKKTGLSGQTEQSDKQTNFPPPAEVEIEIISVPEGAAVWVTGENSSRGTTPLKLAVPRSSDSIDIILKASGHIDKPLALDASRDRIVNINLDPREAPREPEKVKATPPPPPRPEKITGKIKTTKTTKTGGKHTTTGTASGEGSSNTFKAVGD